MISDFYTVVDRISYLLSPQTGLLSVVDFYTSGKTSHRSSLDRAIGGANRQCGWFSRWFWQMWFESDDVILDPQRRDYLEHNFGTLKSFSGRNKFFILPSRIRIPYFIWLGRSAQYDKTDPEEVISNKLTILNARTKQMQGMGLTCAMPPYYYQIKPWRLPYTFEPIHDELQTFIYSFTWEDPYEDMKHLDLSSNDTLLAITSAGDNALHYALAAKPKAIHCVDMNPCQGHLLELKLAAVNVLSYDEYFSMFGLGRLSRFKDVLDSKLSPLLSPACYQFWRMNINMFTSSSTFYMHGYSGNALRLMRSIFKLTGRMADIRRLCRAGTLDEQERIWRERIRPVMLNPLVLSILNNPIVCWKALGVPVNQRRMLLAEGTAYDYIKDTIDPIFSSGTLSNGAYHYLLTLLGHYTSSSCPLYLTRESFESLKADDGARTNIFRIHTDTITSTLRSMRSSSLSRAVIMDHLDWFSEDSRELTDEISLFLRVLKTGGFILFRSVARNPWYIKYFVRAGFDVSCVSVRAPGTKVAIDSVNMYASLWKALKPDEASSSLQIF